MICVLGTKPRYMVDCRIFYGTYVEYSTIQSNSNETKHSSVPDQRVSFSVSTAGNSAQFTTLDLSAELSLAEECIHR